MWRGKIKTLDVLVNTFAAHKLSKAKDMALPLRLTTKWFSSLSTQSGNYPKKHKLLEKEQCWTEIRTARYAMHWNVNCQFSLVQENFLHR